MVSVVTGIYAYVLMTNHVHMLASAPRPYDLSRMMQHLGRRFVRYVNHVYRRSGTLWEERFKDEIEKSLKCAARPPKRGRPARSTMPSKQSEHFS